MEQCWRWFGPLDPVPLAHVRQAGATGVVTALHEHYRGQVWPEDAIAARRAEAEAEVRVLVVAHDVVGAEAAERLEVLAREAEQGAGDAGHGAADEEIAGEVADEFGGAPGAIDDELHTARA